MKFKNCVYGLSTRQAAAGDAHKLTECTHTQPEHRAERTQHVHSHTHTRTLRHSTRAEPPPAAASSKQQQRNSSKRVRVKRSRTQQSAASKNVKKTTESALLCSLLLPLPLCLLCAALSLACLAFAAKTSFQCCVLLPVAVRESARVRPFCIAALSVRACVCVRVGVCFCFCF